MQERS